MKERLRHLVVIVPGICGSVLATEDESLAWGKGLRTLASAMVSPDRLSLTDHRDDLVPVDLVPRTCVMGVTVVHGYDELVRKIITAFPGARVQVAAPGADRSGIPEVLLFPYDFRQPVAESAKRLAEEVGARLAGLSEGARSGRVIVVAHSMGGLVARYWLGRLGGAACCRALITVGTPHRGAPKALDWLINGVRAGPLVLHRATAVLRQWQSAYDLLPFYSAVLSDSSGRLEPEPGRGSAAAGHSAAVYPDELAGLLNDHALDGWFTCRARRGREMQEEIESGWADLAANGTAPEVIPLFGRGHKTLNRAVVKNGRLVVTKDDAEWRPNPGWRGDGTVPAVNAIPRELHDRPGIWQPRPEPHQPMATTSLIVGILRNFAGELPPGRGGGQPDRPWLGLDLDELAPAGQPVAVAAQLLGAAPDSPSAMRASVTAAGQGASASHFPMEYADGWWRAEIPAAEPGAYQVRVEAAGVPRVDRVSCSDVFGVVTG